jgi:hypothetical protein
MATVNYKANLDKFVDSLVPEQIVFLGSLIEKDIAAKEFTNLDLLATLMFDRIKDMNIDDLHDRTHQRFSEFRIE